MNDEDFLAALQSGWHRKGLKWVNGEVIPMTPQEFDDYLRKVPLTKALDGAISDLGDLRRSKVEAQHQ